MEFEFTIDGKPAYLLKKLDPGWELLKYDPGHLITRPGRGQGSYTTPGYKKMAQGGGYYPSSVRGALDLIADDIILSHGNERLPVVDGLRLIKAEIGKLEAAVGQATFKAESVIVPDVPVQN